MSLAFYFSLFPYTETQPSARSIPPLSHLTCTPTEPKMYFTVFSDPDTQKKTLILTYKPQIHFNIAYSLQESYQVRRHV
jgi:hypothetical protein